MKRPIVPQPDVHRYGDRARAVFARLVIIAYAILLIAGLVFYARNVHADSHVITWTPATKNTDGSAIPTTGPGATSGFRIYYGTVSKSYLTPIQLPATAPFTYTLNLPNDGKTYYIAMTQSTSANGANPGGESAKTNELTTTTPPPALPQAPVVTSVSCAQCATWNNLLMGTTGDQLVMTFGAINATVTFNLYKAPKQAGDVPVATAQIAPNATTYTWTGPHAGLYEVQMCNGTACNDSGFRYYLKLAAPGDIGIN